MHKFPRPLPRDWKLEYADRPLSTSRLRRVYEHFPSGVVRDDLYHVTDQADLVSAITAGVSPYYEIGDGYVGSSYDYTVCRTRWYHPNIVQLFKEHFMSWPEPSSPTKSPKVCIYYGRWLADSPQETYAYPLSEPWQAGAILTRIFDRSYLWDFINWSPFPKHTCAVYRLELDRDENNRVTQSYAYYVRVGGDYTITELLDMTPKGEPNDNALRLLRMMARRPIVKQDTIDTVIDQEDGAKVAKPVKVVKERVSREERSKLIAIADLAKAEGIDGFHVRQELRKRKLEKPAAGWAAEEGSDLHKAFIEIINKLKGK